MNPTTSLPAMAWPLMISFTTRFLFSLVDLIFAALIAEGDNSAVAAIGLWAPLQFVFIAIWVGLSGGFTASLSQAFGSRDQARADELKRTMRRVLTWLIPLMSLGGVALWLVIPYLGLEPGLERAFRTYATTLGIGVPLAGFWSIYPDSIVKAHHRTRITMVAGLLTTFANIALNALFALVLGWGLLGIALATVLSRFPSLAYAAIRARELEAERLGKDWEPIPTTWAPPLAAILRLAVPGATTFALGAVESGVVNGVLKGLPEATTAIATYAVWDRLLMFALMPAAATAVAVVPFVAGLLPSGDVARIRADLLRGLLMVVGLSLTITVLVGWVFAGPVTEFLIESEESARPLAVGVVRLLPLGALAICPFYILRPLFEAANLPGRGVLVSVVRYLVFAVPAVLLARRLAPALDLDPLTAIVAAIILASVSASAATSLLAIRTLATHEAVT